MKNFDCRSEINANCELNPDQMELIREHYPRFEDRKGSLSNEVRIL